MLTRFENWICAALLLGSLAGCGGEGSNGEATPQSGAVKTTAKGLEYKVYENDELSKVTLALPPLDQDRVEITGPANWKTQSRSSKYLTGFYRVRPDSPPLIQVTVEEWNEFEPATASLENLDTFIANMAARVAGELKEGQELDEEVYPLILGGRPWARYVRGARFQIKGKLTPGDRQILRTVAGGRMYQIELQVFKGEIPTYRDDAYAVAAHMKFLAATGGVETPMPSEPAPDPAAAAPPPEGTKEGPPSDES